MISWPLGCSLVLSLAALAAALYEHLKMQNMLDSLENMLDLAKKNRLTENQFDESILSKIETEMVHFLRSLKLSAQDLEQERDKIRTLISDISHQSKTPLANLLLYCELLQESTESEEQKNYLEALHQQTDKLRFLIDSLVKLSRLENGTIRLSPAQERVDFLLQRVCSQVLAKAKEKGISLDVIPTPALAVFDKKWTEEALVNLVDNAIKYSEQGTIRLSCTEYEMFVQIDVSDQGIGIDEKELTKIFNRFYRSEQSQKQDGVGLGLYLSREIIRAEGGYIQVRSTLAQGSVFSVFLRKET